MCFYSHDPFSVSLSGLLNAFEVPIGIFFSRVLAAASSSKKGNVIPWTNIYFATIFFQPWKIMWGYPCYFFNLEGMRSAAARSLVRRRENSGIGSMYSSSPVTHLNQHLLFSWNILFFPTIFPPTPNHIFWIIIQWKPHISLSSLAFVC